MLTEVVYLIIGLIGMIFMLKNNDAGGKQGRDKSESTKKIILSAVTLFTTALLMLISSIYIPDLADITGNSQESAQVFFGCLGAVVLPLIMGFVSILIMKKTIDNKLGNKPNKKDLLISVIIAVICAILASVLECINLKETISYIEQIDFNNAMSIMEMTSFKPRFDVLVRILILLPTAAAVIMNLSIKKTEDRSESRTAQ